MKMLLNGEWVDRPQRTEVRDPQDNSVIDTVPLASIEDMQAAINAAAVAFEHNRHLPAHQRMSILRNAAGILEEEHEEYEYYAHEDYELY